MKFSAIFATMVLLIVAVTAKDPNQKCKKDQEGTYRCRSDSNGVDKCSNGEWRWDQTCEKGKKCVEGGQAMCLCPPGQSCGK